MPANPQVTDEMVEKAARAAARANGDDYDAIPAGKEEWTQQRGQFGGLYRDVNAPYQTDYQEMAEAALTAALADHVVVPREPTEAMIFAMHHQIDWCRDDQNTYALEHTSQTDNGIGTTCKQDILDAYRAMISAAPLPQKEG